jgi:mannitol/fructose-specific phosphotransferase system IIA component (Ntr-type)
MTLADFTQERLCVPELRGRDAPSVLLELSLALARSGLVPDSLAVFNSALNGYFLTDRDILGGIAYPVCHLNALHTTTCVIGRSREPLIWRNGAPPVQVVFLVAAPVIQSSGLSMLIEALSDLARDETAIARVRSAVDPAAMLAALARVTVGGGLAATAGVT